MTPSLTHETRETLREIAQRLATAERAVAFTGAGVSTESGISDFRSPGGVWSRHRPVPYDEFLSSAGARARYWAMKREAWREMGQARPNVTHRVLAELERDDRLRAVITQNIDGLHQEAGSERVLELHGTNRHAACVTCGWRCPIDDAHSQMERGHAVPVCPECGGWLKPATVSFGQVLPADVLAASEALSRDADLFLAIGSSLVVYPAAALPRVAASHGAYLAILNREDTPLDSFATAIIRAPLGLVFEEIERLYRTYRGGIAGAADGPGSES